MAMQSQEMLPGGGLGEDDLMDRQDQDQLLAEMELVLGDPALAEQLQRIDAAFDTEAGRRNEETLRTTEKTKDGYAQGGWAAQG